MTTGTRRLKLDECRELPAHSLVRKLEQARVTIGAACWRNDSRFGLVLRLDPDARSLHLEGTLKHATLVDHQLSQTLALATTTPAGGGVRWWFLCPICGRKASSLFLPASQALFACRRCWKLAYRSSQTSGTKAEAEEWDEARRRGRTEKLSIWEARREWRLRRRQRAVVTVLS